MLKPTANIILNGITKCRSACFFKLRKHKSMRIAVLQLTIHQSLTPDTCNLKPET